MIERVKKWLLTPVGKTIMFVLSVIVSGILCGTFVTEITVNGALLWLMFFKTASFYTLLVYIFILYIYNRYIYVEEKNVKIFLDQDYCRAYIRSRSLPAMMSRYEDLISQGLNSTELVEIQSQLEELIK